jgi:tetratricopeptide (TPR) repeat protein/nucleoside phosphorylase
MNNVLLVTATSVEARAVLTSFSRTSETQLERQFIGNKTYYPLGTIGGANIYMVQTEMGTGTPGGALLTVRKGIQDLSAVAVIMVGIAFGTRSDKHKLCDILVSKQIQQYEPQRVTPDGPIPLGDKVSASPHLLDKFRSGLLDWNQDEMPVHFGLILSGEKLVDDLEFRRQLVAREPKAIGGEMEGAGLYVAAQDAEVHWILVKAICDWADGEKDDKHQHKAAENAAAFTRHVIQQGGVGRSARTRSGRHSNYDSDDQEPSSLGASTIPGRYGRPFVGREDELAEMGRMLTDTGHQIILILHGKPGAGKSELGFEYARTNQSRYPGGIFLIQAGSEAAVDLAGLGRNIFGLKFNTDQNIKDQCEQTLQKIGLEPTLLVYDNLISPGDIKNLLPPAGRKCHVIITTIVDRWPSGWLSLAVHEFSHEKALKLIEAYGGEEVAKKYGQILIESSGGLPVQICSLAIKLKHELKRSLDNCVPLDLSEDAEASFKRVYITLDSHQRLMLRAAAHLNPQYIQREKLFDHLSEAMGKSRRELVQILDTCMDLTLLQGRELLRMHQLMASFLINLLLEHDLVDAFRKVRQIQAKQFVESARLFDASPTDVNLAAEFNSFSLPQEAWKDIEEAFSENEKAIIANGLYEMGRWVEALSWLKALVKADENGAICGKIHHVNLGIYLHCMGYCYGSLGNFEEALFWYSRAVEIFSMPDIYGKVDQTNLTKSLHDLGQSYISLGKYEEAFHLLQSAKEIIENGDIHEKIDQETHGRVLQAIGSYYLQLGKFEEALSLLQNAAQINENGYEHGRVDGENLGRSFTNLGFCYEQLGKYEEAFTCYSRAIKAIRKGDVYGRINHESLGIAFDNIGAYYGEIGDFEQALLFYRSAAEAKEKGNIYNTVDHASLGKSLCSVGTCCGLTGNIEESLSWFQRAVNASEKGDLHNRINYETLGRSLHGMGLYYGNKNNIEEALEWFKRAVTAKEKGDIPGIIDYDSLAQSIHEVGYSYSIRAEFAEALTWYKRAVEAAEKGDQYGRIDFQTIAKSLHEIGHCYSSQGRLEEALLWFERAVKAAEKGDIRERVDEKSLKISREAVSECLKRLNRI